MTLDGNKYQADDKRVKFRREGDDVLFLAIDNYIYMTFIYMTITFI